MDGCGCGVLDQFQKDMLHEHMSICVIISIRGRWMDVDVGCGVEDQC